MRASSDRFTRRLAVLSAAVACALTGVAHAGEPSPWLQYGHDGRQSNVNDTESTLTPSNVASLRPVRKKHGPSAPMHLPVAEDGYIYAADANKLAAMDGEAWRPLWADAKRSTTCTPAITADGRIMVIADVSESLPHRGRVSGIDTATGAVLWQSRIEGAPNPDWSACPAIEGELVLVSERHSSDGWASRYITLNVRDGTWGIENDYGIIYVTVDVVPHAAVQGDWYYEVTPSVREVAQLGLYYHTPFGWWTYLGTETNGVPSIPRIGGDALLVSDSEGGVYAYELLTGQRRWTVVLPTAPGTTPGVSALTATTAFAVVRPAKARSDAIRALAMSDGKVLWTAPLDTDSHVHSNLVLANGMIFAGTGADGSCTTLTVVDATTGVSLANLPTTMPADGADQCELAIADGQVIIHGTGASGPVFRLLGLPGS